MYTKLFIIIGALLFLSAITLIRIPVPKKAGNTEEFSKIFKTWQQKYGKSYESNELAYRFEIFQQNYQYIQKANEANNLYTLGLNQFADLTSSEFAETYLGLKTDSEENKKTKENLLPKVKGTSVDWRTKGAVTPIKDQGQCGSCWAFSTTGSLEGSDAIFGTGLHSYSEQQLVDCSLLYGNLGCNGGLMDRAFKYVEAKGIAYEDVYPYDAKLGTCQKTERPFTISKHTDVKKGDCDQLKAAITQQPISIGVDASNWQFYSSGVFNDCKTAMDHGVLAVGFTDDYWIVKNSWNTSWGEQGYIRLSPGNTCGLCDTASYPTI